MTYNSLLEYKVGWNMEINKEIGKKRVVLVFMVIGALTFGFVGVLTRICLFPDTVIASFRLLLAGLFLTPFCITGVWKLLKKQGIKKYLLLLIPALFLGLHFHLWVMGLKRTYIATASFIVTLSPVFFALAERLIFRGRINKKTYIALGLVVAGALWLLRIRGGKLGKEGDLFCFASMLLFVIYLLVSQRVSRNVPHLVYIHTIYLWGGLLTLPLCLITGDLAAVRLNDLASLSALMALVLFPSLIGHTTLNYGVRYFPPLTVSFFTLLEPVFATITAAIFLSEFPGIGEFPSYILFLSATVIIMLKMRTKPG